MELGLMNPLWSLMFALGLLAPSVTASPDFTSSNMKEDVNKLKTHYGTNDSALFGRRLFLHDLQKFEENDQRLLLRESLDVYGRILSDMLNSTKEMAIKHSILAIRAQMEDLKKSHFHSRESLRKELTELWDLKTDDAMTQRRAVRELMQVFHTASRLASAKQEQKEKRRRRRRQIPRGRAPRP